jgi:putative transposase
VTFSPRTGPFEMRDSGVASQPRKCPMARRRHAEDQILQILREHEAGAKTPDLARRHGVSNQTFYRWKSQYGGLELSEMRRLRQLEDENRRLKDSVAGLTLDKQALELRLSRKF